MDDLYRLAKLPYDASVSKIQSVVHKLHPMLARRVVQILLMPNRRRAYDSMLAIYKQNMELREKLGVSVAGSGHRNGSSTNSGQPGPNAGFGGVQEKKKKPLAIRIVIGIATAALILSLRNIHHIYREVFPDRSSSYTYNSMDVETSSPLPDSTTVASNEQMTSSEEELDAQSELPAEPADEPIVDASAACEYRILVNQWFDNPFGEGNDIADKYRSLPGGLRFPMMKYFNNAIGLRLYGSYPMVGDDYTSYDDCLSQMRTLEREYDVDLFIACVKGRYEDGNRSIEVVQD